MRDETSDAPTLPPTASDTEESGVTALSSDPTPAVLPASGHLGARDPAAARPDFVGGTDHRRDRLPVGAAIRPPRQRTSAFLGGLTHDMLLKLRVVVKQVHMHHYPADKLTDHEADRIIEALGPGSLQNLLRDHIDGKALPKQ